MSNMKLNHRQRRHADKIFKQALKQAERVESGMKRTIANLPFVVRLAICWKIMRKTWK